MVFANLLFLYLFLPLNILLYFLIKNHTARNVIQVVFSLIFYAWGEPVWIFLLLFTTFADLLFGMAIETSRAKGRGKLPLVLSLVFNLGILGVFKYSGFFLENLNSLFGWRLPLPSFTLPIGISFYTFQIISYLVDVYRGEVKAQRSYLKFLLYVSMYFQLVAGPIVRYQVVEKEIEHRTTTLEDFSTGLTRFLVGLAKKVVIANTAGTLASQYLDGNLSQLSVLGAWFGILLFTLQIYYDFSGYSDMAIGLGRIFGFHLDENFNYPYISRTATEFWRRWHISLGSFFRDYLYIPMGGNRRRPYLNLFVVWFLTGMWHGASWNFILWGLYFGLLIFAERLFLKRLLEKLPRILSAFFSHLYLLLAVMVGWVFFYFTDLNKVWEFLGILFGAAGHALSDLGLEIAVANNLWWLLISVAFCLPIVPAVKRLFDRRPGGQVLAANLQILTNVVLLLACTALLVGQSYNPFLYYRF